MSEGRRINPLGFATPERRRIDRDLDTTREVLRQWLAHQLAGASDLRLSPLSVPSGNGVANETFVFEGIWQSAKKEHRQRFVARLESDDPLFTAPPFSAHYKMYQELAGDPDLPVPAVYGYEADPELLGAAFFVLEFIDGVIPSDRAPHWSEGGWLAEATPAQRETLWTNFVAVMARLHATDTGRFPFLQRPELGASGLEQELAHWETYYRQFSGDRIHPVMEDGLEWLLGNVPESPPTGLAWGDARISNIIFRDFLPVAVLDWDMASLAGAEIDLGWWINSVNDVAQQLDGMGTARETIEVWESLSGRQARDMHYSLVFNAFRTGAIRIKLARDMLARGTLPPESAELETNNTAIQQVALLLGLAPPGRVTTARIEID